MTSLNFRIERVTFDKKETIKAAQKCLTEAQLSLINPAFKLSVQYFFSQPKNLFIFYSFIVMVTLIMSKLFNFSMIKLTILIGFLSTLIFVILLYYLHRKAWFGFLNYVFEKSDLSDKLANGFYSKDNNAFFIAYTPENEIASMAAILIDEEKHVCAEEWIPRLEKDEALLLRVATVPKFQGKGAAKAVLQACFNFAKEKNVKRIKLTQTNKQIPAYKLYKKLGFRTTRKNMIYNYIYFYIRLMEKEL
ncbi:unnamed protein product [Brachionus calyciflorus]|uniref:N-acetyltransferase domain-containing protein n=1 Tax=Brachionus calyciflorus TaxID=104777 RepID=A0A814HP93_9BILA|nr:unnamed protein product [Brachionus calyciflorus]